MRRFFSSVCLVVAGICAGWWLRDLADPGQKSPRDEAHMSARPSIQAGAPAAIPAGEKSVGAAPRAGTDPARPDAESFAALLESGEFEQAIAYYESALRTEENYQAVLKPAVEHYLAARVQKCADDEFVDLVDQWLDAYYADIEVLLLLAEYQRYCSSSEEAARTLQIASTYALLPGQRERVAGAVAELIAATGKRLSRNRDWIGLLGFYEFLDAIDLETRASQLSRASLYERVGEVQRSRSLLLALQESDDGLDPEWTVALNQHLARSAPEPVADELPEVEISLTRRGNHYLVPALLNDLNQLVLLIDTGASMTTLSRERFSRIGSTGTRYLGTQLFNTPNGITQGEVYRADAIQLGDTTVRDIDIAVLEFETSDDFDGLLGMNVLRHYRFNIDQDREVLQLTPRH